MIRPDQPSASPKTSNSIYRQSLNDPMDSLVLTLVEFGFDVENLRDSKLIEVATRKLRTLHGMVLATDISKNLLISIMKE